MHESEEMRCLYRTSHLPFAQKHLFLYEPAAGRGWHIWQVLWNLTIFGNQRAGKMKTLFHESAAADREGRAEPAEPGVTGNAGENCQRNKS